LHEGGFKLPLRIVDRIAELKVPRIVLTGGEPMLNRFLGRVIREAKQLGMIVQVSTTGDLLKSGFLKKYGSCIDSLSLPLDGPNETVNGKMRTPGHFERVMQAIRLVSEYPGIQLKFTSVISKKNLQDGQQLIEALVARTQNAVKKPAIKLVQFLAQRDAVRFRDEFEISAAAFGEFKAQVLRQHYPCEIKLLSSSEVDDIYTQVFPNGEVVVPKGAASVSCGNILDPFFRFDSDPYRQAIDLGKREHKWGYIGTLETTKQFYRLEREKSRRFRHSDAAGKNAQSAKGLVVR
jgi:sulfatase maturation enzyme AslB (radical SAM superfamily)